MADSAAAGPVGSAKAPDSAAEAGDGRAPDSPAGGGPDSRAATGGGARPAAGRRRRATAVPALPVEVWWADITRVPGDVHVVGHYENVMPAFAELALDRVVSGRDAPDEDLVLTNLTRRGIVQGKLGNVELFPWAAGERPGRLVAVAGMGHPGSFQEPELRRLARNVTWTMSSLPDAHTVCMVLIGGGTGNLPVDTALRGLVHGTIEGLGAVGRRVIERVRIVELELGKATRIHRALQALAATPQVRERVTLELGDDVRHGDGGVLGGEHCLALTLAAAARAAGGPAGSAERKAVERLLATVREPAEFGDRALETFARLVADGPGGNGRKPARAGARKRLADVADLAARLTVAVGSDGRAEDAERPPLRMSFVRDGNAIVTAALTDTAVVPERRSSADPALLEEAVAETVDPDPALLARFSASLHRYLVPEDFKPILEREHTMVFEVDRTMATVPWEMLASRLDDLGLDGPVPLALRAPVARQLRTTYSPPPGVARATRWPLRALVIGDPGDPEAGDSLPGARREALEVAELLRAKEVEVELMIGAPGARRAGLPADVPPARRWDVLDALMSGDFDLLHYAGHGDFDPDDPTRTGWVFKGGLLTSHELSRVGLSPSLVVANACLSARTSEVVAGGRRVAARRTEAELLPGLADEFFRRGVRNYVGTAWEVNDEGAVEFARVFYDALLPEPDAEPAEQRTVGRALLAARRALHQREAEYGALWAAYQHYGDPGHTVSAGPPATGDDAESASGGRVAARRGAARRESSRRRS